MGYEHFMQRAADLGWVEDFDKVSALQRLKPAGNILKTPSRGPSRSVLQGPSLPSSKPTLTPRNPGRGPGPKAPSAPFGGGVSNMAGATRAAIKVRSGGPLGVSGFGLSAMPSAHKGWPKSSAFQQQLLKGMVQGGKNMFGWARKGVGKAWSMTPASVKLVGGGGLAAAGLYQHRMATRQRQNEVAGSLYQADNHRAQLSNRYGYGETLY